MNKFAFRKVILLVGDILLLYASLFLTLMIRYQGPVSTELWSRHVVPFSILFALWIVVFYINNLYTIQQVKNDFQFYSYLVQNLLINLAIGFTFFYLAPSSITSLTPFRVLIILILIFAFLFLVWRKIFYSITSSTRLSNRVLFIGLNDESIDLALQMINNPQMGYSPIYFVDPNMVELPEKLISIPRQREIAGLTDIIKKYNIQIVVTVSSSSEKQNYSRYLFETLKMGLAYYTFADFYEKLTGKVPVASLEETWFLENLLKGNKTWFEASKRLADIIFSLIFGILSLIFVPFLIILVKLTSPGPILFKQKRTGKGGKEFLAMKFRTMVVDAEKDGPQWASKNDPRVTKLGKFMRKTRLDEIPQFINIFKGDMTFVGPRPERPEFVKLLSEKIPFYNERLLVKPGLSGWAQINFKYGDSVEDAMTKLQYDLFYIKNRSFALDLSIVLKTVNTVLNASFGQ